jgi:hypothetical protein
MNVLGQSIIVIDKYETAVELLDKRSGIYSSRFVTSRQSFLKCLKINVYGRPISPTLGLIPGWGDSLAFLPYGNIKPAAILLICSPILSRGPLVYPLAYFKDNNLISSQAPPPTSFCTSDQRETKCAFPKSH